MNKRNIKEVRISEVRELQNELSDLMMAERNLGYIILPKPIRNGYYKHLILRDDIARRKDAHIFSEILSKTGTRSWGRDKKHADKIWNNVNRKDKEIQFPGCRRLSQKLFDKLSPKAQRYFTGYQYSWDPWTGNVMKYYCNVPKYFFKLTYSKSYITKRRIIDSELSSRIQEIENILLRPEYYSISWNGYSSYNKWESRYLNRRLRKKVNSALSQYSEDYFDSLIYRDFKK